MIGLTTVDGDRENCPENVSVETLSTGLPLQLAETVQQIRLETPLVSPVSAWDDSRRSV